MNKRIKELVKQADACYISRYDMWQMDTETMEKFAELIVRECAELMYGRDENGNCKDGDVIKKHFGVAQ